MCHQGKEDWLHVLTYQDVIEEFNLKLKNHRTYYPLRIFLLDCARHPSFDPPLEPLSANNHYSTLLHEAYVTLSIISWEIFYRGFLSNHWKKIQHRYYKDTNHSDIYAVDKWCRMVLTHILELSRIQWNERCTIVSAERDLTYEGRVRKQMMQLCKYLNHNSDLIPTEHQHLIHQKYLSTFFSQASIPNSTTTTSPPTHDSDSNVNSPSPRKMTIPSTSFQSYRDRLMAYTNTNNPQITCNNSTPGFKRCINTSPNKTDHDDTHKKTRLHSPIQNENKNNTCSPDCT